MTKRPLFLLVLLALLAPDSAAQRARPGRPPTRDLLLARRLRADVPVRRMERVDAARLRAEDALAPKGAPLRYGVVLPLELSAAEDGLWEELPDGARLWRQELVSPGARSLGVLFRRFRLPAGAELWVHGADGALLGAYTDANHGPRGRFAVQPLPGERLTLELRLPPGAARPDLRLAGLVHDYAGVLDHLPKAASGGASGACELDVLCAAEGWEEPIDSVVRILSGGLLCSGALLNNTAEDGAQLLLTAEHCGDLEDGVFYFNYQRPSCGAGSAPATQTVQGSLPLARSSARDVQLVRLTEPVPDAYGAFLAGWDRSGADPAETAAIHHPLGLPKKISFDHDPPRKNATQWRILRWDVGVTEPGSSGSPLFSPEGLVIGQLCCGRADCGAPFDDYYGRLDAEWSLLAPWLDPLGSGVSSLRGLSLVGKAPEPFALAAVEPASVAALDPGSTQRVRLLGSGFSSAARVFVDGLPRDPAAYTVVDGSTITLDMPQVPFLGRHTLTVVDQNRVESVFVDIVAAPAPLLQAGIGDPPPGNLVRSAGGLALVLAGPPGELQYVLFSASSEPSVHPMVSLCLGDGFRDLGLAAVETIPAAGWTETTVGLPPAAMEIWLQSVTLQSGLPIPTSNCQAVSVIP